MVLKRHLKVGGEGSSEFQNKRRHLPTALFKGVNNARSVQEYVPLLEPIIRKWVQEAVESSIQRILRHSHSQIECSGTGSRTLQLRFQRDLPHTLFTGHRVMYGDRSPVRITLHDSESGKLVSSGPFSSTKVSIVVLDADFGDREEWTKKNFDGSVAHSREGKRPLVTGELTITLQDGVGYFREVRFTDNSSWLRSGKFRLGAKASSSDEIREGVSNSFKVKDQRGESYQKHYPPSLEDEVWRLEKIAKEGASHKILAHNGILCVRDFLRLYVTNQSSLRAMLPNISNKTWVTILEHATTCTLDDKRFLFETALGTGLLFNSIYKVVGITDGQSYQSLDNLNLYQMRMLEDLKHHAYKNLKDWVPVDDISILGYPLPLGNTEADNLNNLVQGVQDNYFQEKDQLDMQLNTDRPSISPPSNCEVEETNSFEFGEGSYQMQRFAPTFRNSFEMNISPGGFYTGEHTLAFGTNYVVPQLSTDDIPVEDFQVEPSVWKANHEIGIFSSDSGILIPETGKTKTRWCKVLAVVKWRILVRRNVAARKWQRHINYFLM